MLIIVYILAVIFFTAAYVYLKLFDNFRQVVIVSRSSISVLNNRQLSDEIKEAQTKKAAINLFKQSALIIIKSLVIVFITLVPFYLANILNLVEWDIIIEFSLRADVLLITFLIMIGAVFICRRRKFN